MEDHLVTDPERMAAIMIGFPDAHVLCVDEDEAGLWVEVETRVDVAKCPTCGEGATQTRTRGVDREGLPVFGRALHLSWKLRGWRCTKDECPTGLWFEEVPEPT